MNTSAAIADRLLGRACGLGHWTFAVLHEYASGHPDSVPWSHDAAWRFCPSTMLGTLSLSNGRRAVMNNAG
ncbi:MAG: hypothetical protein OEY86_00340 [Nitrospira sp.]|nr:hypothetical protein [Nitrospira sp.]